MRTKNISRRSVLLGASAVAGSATLLPGVVKAQSSGILRVAQPWEFRSLKLSETGFAYTRSGLLETLVAADTQGRIMPAIAESWSVSDNASVWRFRIRQGVVFHDGTACTPAAIKASFERLLPMSLYLKSAGITAIEVDGDHLVFRLKESFGPLLAYLVDNSASVVAPAAFNAQNEVTTLIGTGPFKLDMLESQRSMSLARHDSYWGVKANVARVRYDAVTNGETRGNIAIAGDADLVFNIPAPSVRRVEAAREMRVERPIIPRVHILMLNCNKPQFSDRRARQALNLALDRQAIASGIMRNPSLAATQYMPPALADWHFSDIAGHRHDVAAANSLLDQAGWTRSPDGIRSKDGVRFAGTIRTFANRPELPIIATAMQTQFREIGFDLSISVGESLAIVEGQRDGTIDLGLSSRNLTMIPDPIATVALDFATDTISAGAVGVTGWRNDALRDHVKRYMREVDNASKAAIRRKIVDIIHTEVPLIPVVWYDQIVAVNRRVDGFRNDPFEQRLYLNEVKLTG